jgi:hypothetical protein
MSATASSFDAVKARRQRMWANGDYAAVAARIHPMAERLCEAANLLPGIRVLDVATGRGDRRGAPRLRRGQHRLLVVALLAGSLAAVALAGAGPAVAAPPQTQCAPAAAMPAASSPVAYWSTEARCAIVPAGPGGSFGSENFGNKFPGEAAVYMGIVHVAIYDATVAIEGGYRPYSITLSAPDASPEAAIATATHDTLAGLPALGLSSTQQAILEGDYVAYMNAIADGRGKDRGIAVGRKVAAAVLALRANDGLEKNPSLADLNPPRPGPGRWHPAPGPVLGLRLPRVRPLALRNASQLRPDGPNSLTSREYAGDLNQVEDLGRIDSMTRTPEQTTQARFWTDHDLRQWNDGMLGLAADRALDLVQTARMLAMAHVAGADAMIACFDAKYHYWFWRPDQAIPLADTDGNPDTVPDPNWAPLGTTPNFPEYPSAHACHSTAVVTALDAFFGTDKIPFTLDSRIPHTTRQYQRLHDIVDDVDWARVLVGFHFRNSDLQGTALGRKVGRYVADRHFQPLGRSPCLDAGGDPRQVASRSHRHRDAAL